MYYKVVFISYVIYVLHIIDISNQVNCNMFCQNVKTYVQAIAEVTDLTPSVLRLNLPQPNSGGVEMSPVSVQMMMMVIRVERGVDRGNCLS